MSDDELRDYFEELTDQELRDCYAAGSSAFEPEAWRLLSEQLHRRGLEGTEVVPDIASQEAPIAPATVASPAELQKRVKEGGTIALTLSAIALAGGTSLALYLRSGLVESRAITLTTAYVIAGILMRRRYNMWAAGVAALLTNFVFVGNAIAIGTSYPWFVQALNVLLYGPPTYWLWTAFLSAKALSRDGGAVATFIAE